MSNNDSGNRKKRNIYWLMGAPDKDNLAVDLTNAELGMLGADVVRTYDLDVDSRSEWNELSESAMKLAKQVKEPKSWPWPKASNVKHPLITVASIQFAARAYPEIVKGTQVVKCQITGDEPPVAPPMPSVQQGMILPSIESMPAPDGGNGSMPPSGPEQMPGLEQMMQGLMPTGTGIPSVPVPVRTKTPKQDRSERIQTHMNFQLTQEMKGWEEDMDRLLHILPVLGQCFKKTYFSPSDKRNVSELVLPDDCVVNIKARSIDNARRITHRIWLYENDVYEKVRRQLWLDVPLGLPPSTDSDTDAPHEFLEQHRWDDLDGDGYKEPYIVTVHRQTAQVVRVLARWQPTAVDAVNYKGSLKVAKITPDQYFTHFGFIPNPDGTLNYLGFGQLLEPLNAAINSTLNQLIDAGTLYNAGGGFIGRGVKMRGGTASFQPGEWKFVDVVGGTLKDNMLPIPVHEPSAVLFQLLGFLVNAGQEISSVQNVMSGESNLAATMPVGTVMALVEQGLKVFTAIYKRVYRSLTDEFRKLYDLNAKYLEPDFTFALQGDLDSYQIGQKDYQEKNLSVVPVADPNLSSDMQRLLKAQALKDLSGRPGINEIELTRRLVKAIQPDNVDLVLYTDEEIEKQGQTPNPAVLLAQAKAQRLTQQAQEAGIRLQMDLQRFQVDVENVMADVGKKKAETVLALTRAQKEAADSGSEQAKLAVAIYKAEMDVMSDQIKHQADMIREKIRAFSSGVGITGTGGEEEEGEGKQIKRPVRPQLEMNEMASLPGSTAPATAMGPAGQMRGVTGGTELSTSPGMPSVDINDEMAALVKRPEPGLDMGAVGRASGGPVTAGQPYIVGEEGPEQYVPNYGIVET